MTIENRSVSVKTPLGDDELLFRSMTGTEEMGRLFEFEVELIREQAKGSVDIARVLGQNITLTLEMPDTSTRYFNGFKQTYNTFKDGSVAEKGEEKGWDLSKNEAF